MERLRRLFGRLLGLGRLVGDLSGGLLGHLVDGVGRAGRFLGRHFLVCFLGCLLGRPQPLPERPQPELPVLERPEPERPDRLTRLKSERVQFRIEYLPGWRVIESTPSERRAAWQEFEEALPIYTAIQRDFHLPGFAQAMDFVDRVADLALEMGVDPGICVHGDHVSVCLPGDREGLSEADFDLAETLEYLA